MSLMPVAPPTREAEAVLKGAPQRDPDGNFRKGNKMSRGRPQGPAGALARRMGEKLTLEGEAIIDAVIAHAKAGDPTAMKLCGERLLPTVDKGHRVPEGLEMPPIDPDDPETFVKFQSAVVERLASGMISDLQAQTLSKALDTLLTTIEAVRTRDEMEELREEIAALKALE